MVPACKTRQRSCFRQDQAPQPRKRTYSGKHVHCGSQNRDHKRGKASLPVPLQGRRRIQLHARGDFRADPSRFRPGGKRRPYERGTARGNDVPGRRGKMSYLRTSYLRGTGSDLHRAGCQG